MTDALGSENKGCAKHALDDGHIELSRLSTEIYGAYQREIRPEK